jgi:hypothetical protein
MQQWYQCPSCGAPVAFGVKFCGNCGTQLNWPVQQQPQHPPAYQEPQQQRGYGHGQVKAQQQKTSLWLIISIALIVAVVLVGGGVFAFNAISGKTPSSSSLTTTPPSSTPPTGGLSASDVTPPTIRNVKVTSVTETSAVITWTTDEPATSQVEYETATSYGSTTPMDANLVTSHSVTLSGLSASTTYHFKVKSKDASGNETVDSDRTFTTSAVLLSEPLQYRELDSLVAGSVEDMRHRAAMYGYDLPDEIVGSPDFALYVVVQNLDDVSGTFEIRYTLTTADKEAAEKQMWLIQRTPEEYAELKREYYEGSIKLYLEPGEIGVAICPPGGIYIAPDRVPFDHKREIIPDTKKKSN